VQRIKKVETKQLIAAREVMLALNLKGEKISVGEKSQKQAGTL